MPLSKGLRILPEIVASLPPISEITTSDNEINEQFHNQNEFEGEGLHFKI